MESLLLSPRASPRRDLCVGVELISSDGTLWRVAGTVQARDWHEAPQEVLAQAIKRTRDPSAVPILVSLRRHTKGLEFEWDTSLPAGVVRVATRSLGW